VKAEIDDGILFIQDDSLGGDTGEIGIPIERILVLQAENRHMKESLCTMPKCEHVDKLQAENNRLRQVMFIIREQCKAGITRPIKIARTIDRALSIGG
jgi:hypothetical protein